VISLSELARLPWIWGLDALCVALLVGYMLYSSTVSRRHPECTHQGRSNRLRRAWIESVRAGSKDALAIATLRNWVMSTTLFASTCILIGLGIISVTFGGLDVADPSQALSWMPSNVDIVRVKLLLLAALFFAGFMQFLLALRYYNQAGFVINLPDGRAEQALAGIRTLLALRARCRRDGQWIHLDAADLVPGDSVRLVAGDRVPADLRLSEAAGLRIDESALTGESLPADKDTDPVDLSAGIGDRRGLAYAGTLVAAGSGSGVVTGTGSRTELGRIGQMIAEVETLSTPLTRQMAAFGRVLSVVIVAMAAGMFVIGWLFHDLPLGELVMAAIGFAVAAIPEGLPAILTITLALGVQKMARRNAITRRLPAVETLGSVTVICTDKTGTLTRNEMTVRHVVTRVGQYQVSGAGYAPDGLVRHAGQAVALAETPDLLALGDFRGNLYRCMR